MTVEEYLNFVGIDSEAGKEILEIEEEIKEYYGYVLLEYYNSQNILNVRHFFFFYFSAKNILTRLTYYDNISIVKH